MREAKEIAFQVLTISHRSWDSVIPVSFIVYQVLKVHIVCYS